MTEPAPWEARELARTRRVKGSSDTDRILPPDKYLPDIYKADGGAFVVPSGKAVPRPPATPRPMEPRALLVLLGLVGASIVGVLGVIFSFTLLPAEAGNIRFIYASFGIIIGALGIITLAVEIPRAIAYRTLDFMPGVLVYGSKSQMEAAAGPAGLGSVQMHRARGSGRGLLSLVFDRSSKLAGSPEYVALHCNRGSGPEYVGIDWGAVREHQRGDIIWFHMKSKWNFLMFHKLIPYGPTVITDRETRDEVYTALQVGSLMFKARIETKNMGKPKPVELNEDGKIVTQETEDKKAYQPEQPDDAPELKLTPKGAKLGGDDASYPDEEDFEGDDTDGGDIQLPQRPSSMPRKPAPEEP